LEWSLGEGRTAHDRLLGELPVKQVMRSSVKTVRSDARLTEAAELMAENKISCLPVTEENRLVGIITAGDFLAMLTGATYGDEGD
jgi:CBS domain-containing protein